MLYRITELGVQERAQNNCQEGSKCQFEIQVNPLKGLHPGMRAAILGHVWSRSLGRLSGRVNTVNFNCVKFALCWRGLAQSHRGFKTKVVTIPPYPRMGQQLYRLLWGVPATSLQQSSDQPMWVSEGHLHLLLQGLSDLTATF